MIEDKQAAKADVAVIVTDALPEHVQHMGGVRGVLLTTFSLAACLAETLRVNMALLGQTRMALSGQDDQKSRIFQYFTSPQFHERMATIAEQFQQMQADLTREKAAMNRADGRQRIGRRSLPVKQPIRAAARTIFARLEPAKLAVGRENVEVYVHGSSSDYRVSPAAGASSAQR